MKRYSQSDEENVRTQALVREWQRSGLLEASQALRLEAELRVDLKRTNSFFRAVLFLFTAIMIAASVGLIAIGFDLNDRTSRAGLTFVAAIACVILAESLVGRFRLYRFGVEEALASASAALLGISAGIIATVATRRPGEFPVLIGLAAGALGASGIYLRFGYVYAAIAAMACAAGLPFQTGIPDEMARAAAATILGIVFVVVHRYRIRFDPEGQRYGFTPARLLAGDRRVLDALGTASAALQSQMPPAPAARSKPEFGGGRSGGAGASGDF